MSCCVPNAWLWGVEGAEDVYGDSPVPSAAGEDSDSAQVDSVKKDESTKSAWRRWKEYEIMHTKEVIVRVCVIGFVFTFVTLGILQWDRKQRSDDHKYDLYLFLVSHSYHDTWHGRLI